MTDTAEPQTVETEIAATPLATPPGAVDPVQVSDAQWFIEMSFRTSLRPSKGEMVAQITGVSEAAALNPSSDWIATGIAIMTVNGAKIGDGMTVEQALLGVPDLGQSSHVSAPVTYKIAANRRLENAVLSVPLVRIAELKTGIKIETRGAGDTWRSQVKSVDNGIEGGLVAGDILVRELTLGRLIDGAMTFEEVIGALAQDQVTQARFEVLRNGETAEAVLPLATE